MLNRVILIGRLVVDPELKTTAQGTNMLSVRIAVDRAFTPKDGEKKSDFITVVLWRQQAEFVSRFFSKGRLIGIEGSIQTRDYTDKEGNKRYAVEVLAERAFFVDSKSSANASGGNTASAPSQHPDNSSGGVAYTSGSAGDFEVVDDDDLPF